jgi:serine protease Do
MSKFWFFILVVLVGSLSGILASQFLVPYLAHTSPFDQISWLKQAKDGTTIINKTEQVVVEESTAAEDAINKISPSIVGIIAKSKAGTVKTPVISSYGTGFIVTSDGMVITDTEQTAEKNYDYSVLKDGQIMPATVVKKDAAAGLVLLKIDQTNLPVVSFADFDSLKLGQKAILVGIDSSVNPIIKFVDAGIIKTLSDKDFSLSMAQESAKASGAPLINIKGEVSAMAQVGSDGIVKIVGAEAIKKFMGQ